MTRADHTFPFTAVVGQDRLKHALVLTAVCPALGGVLAAGDRGTAKTTTARGLAALLPRLAVVRGRPFRCDPAAVWPDCPHCRGAADLVAEEIGTPFVELPLGQPRTAWPARSTSNARCATGGRRSDQDSSPPRTVGCFTSTK